MPEIVCLPTPQISPTKRAIQQIARENGSPTARFASICRMHGERGRDRKIVLVSVAVQCESDGVSL
jgi:hypothetical protein